MRTSRQPVRYRPCEYKSRWIQSYKVLACLSFLSATLLTMCNNTSPANWYRLWLHLERFQEHFVERIQHTADSIQDSSEQQTGQLKFPHAWLLCNFWYCLSCLIRFRHSKGARGVGPNPQSVRVKVIREFFDQVLQGDPEDVITLTRGQPFPGLEYTKNGKLICRGCYKQLMRFIQAGWEGSHLFHLSDLTRCVGKCATLKLFAVYMLHIVSF